MSAEFPMIDPVPYVANYCDRQGAEDLKVKIETYWACRGKRVHVWIEKKGFSASLRCDRYDVRSDLVDGMPSTKASEERNAA